MSKTNSFSWLLESSHSPNAQYAKRERRQAPVDEDVSCSAFGQPYAEAGPGADPHGQCQNALPESLPTKTTSLDLATRLMLLPAAHASCCCIRPSAPNCEETRMNKDQA
eukprot:6185099-Pleurochrysis_carterae.AAC.1